MEDWEKATNKFLEKWKKDPKVIGITICGSYITGNPTKNSDIDIRITFSDNIDYRERGNQIVDGYLMEYMANPISREYKYFEEEYENRGKSTAHMFSTGRVIYDKTGQIKKLVQEAKKWNKKKFKKASKAYINDKCYFLWDNYDNLEEVYDRGLEDFYFVYYNFLNNIFEFYSAYLGHHNARINKNLRLLKNKKDQVKYDIDPFPDDKFTKLFYDSLKIKEDKAKMMKSYKKLNDYVLDKMGFNGIDGWKVRGRL